MTLTTPSSLEIAQAATLRPISDVAADLGVAEEHLEHYGTGVAKIALAALDDAPERESRARSVVVTAGHDVSRRNLTGFAAAVTDRLRVQSAAASEAIVSA